MGLTQAEVHDLVYNWFRKLTIKVPVDEMLDMLSTDPLEMKFPEKTMRSQAEFKQWYDDVTHLFFDQVHDVRFLAVDVNGDEATVHLYVNWQARTWKAPAGFSEWQGWLVVQNWVVKHDPISGKAVIVKYEVGHMDPMDPVH